MVHGQHFIFLVALLTVVFCKKQQPNIIFMVGDDVGWNDVGYNNPIFKTPNIDSLAASGVKLTNYYVGEVCAPSRNMLMTGRYGCHNGIPYNLFGKSPVCLPFDEVTIADKLKSIGYSTHIVGKWHCGYYSDKCLPQNRGFDTYFGYLSSSIHKFDHKCSFGVWDLRNMTVNEGPRYNGTYITHLFTGEAERLIEQHDPDKPMFLYLAYSANHAPLDVPEEYTEPFKSDIQDEDRLILAGMASGLDESVGKIISKLKSHGLYDNSIIVFTSDNGGSTPVGGNNWPLRGNKGQLYEGGVRVPAFVAGDLLTESVRGKECDELLHITDWFPTLVHLAGGSIHGTKPLDGFNQWKTISEGVKSEREEILLNLNQHGISELDSEDETVQLYANNEYFNISMSAGIRVGKWKLITGDTKITNRTQPPELVESGVLSSECDCIQSSAVNLFDLENDPTESNNLATVHPHKVMELLKRLGKYLEGAVQPATGDSNDPMMDFDIMGDLLGPWVK